MSVWSSPDAALLVMPLQAFGQDDLAMAGGKGANLGELIRAGFSVPPGFVVTTVAYDRFIAHSDLGEVIAQALCGEGDGGTAIREALNAASIPEEIEGDILAAYGRLAPHPVAVRSSATAEDLPEAAFAGQQDTFLNVIGEQALLDALHRCWASLWTDRAVAYRDRLGLDQRTVKMAVVVQRMVAAEAAGVLFTANTVTGARDEVVIEASPGLGEAVVSGQVTPDHFVLRKRWWGWAMAERRLGQREVIVRPRPGGGTEHVEEPTAVEGPAVPDRALRQLARTGTAIQQHFGAPQDIEWAWADGELFILQARPITALPDPPPRTSRLRRLVASNFAEIISFRPYPLDMTTLIPALSGALEPPLKVLGLDWHLGQLFETEDGVVLSFEPILPHPTWRTLLAPVRLLSLALRYDPLHWQSDPLLAEIQTRADDLESRDPRALSWDRLLATVHAAKEIPSLVGELRRRYFPGAAFAAARLRLLLGLLGHTDQFATLLLDIPHKTLEVNRALERLADQVRADPDLANTFSAHAPEELWSALETEPSGRAFLVQLRAFLDRYGHRETVISTALRPTWGDAPEVVLGIIKNFTAHRARRQTGKPAWQEVRDELLRHPLLRFGPLRSAFLKILAKARTLFQIREDTHFYATLALPVLRRTFLECGRRLVEAHVLDAPEDVFHLTLEELERLEGRLPPPPDLAATLRASMMRRKEKRAEIEDTLLVDPRLFSQGSSEDEEVLRGMTGSPGVAEGPARIVRDGSEFDKLRPGDVLVAPYTNPSWTPLFQRAVAVVVDSGSVGSHAAIVAREYGIPAVMATGDGTHRLTDGQQVRVDGSRGVVYLKDEAE